MASFHNKHAQKRFCTFPFPTETAKGTKCTACLDVDDIEKKIEDAKAVLAGMQEQRLKLLSKANRAHDPIFRRFSPEIIAEIFQHTFWTHQELQVWSFKKRPRWLGPHTLTAVSRTWRELTIGTPSLWTMIPLIVSGNPYPAARLVDLWASRSGTMPLSIFLHFDGLYSRRNATDDIMCSINAISHRLVYLRAQGPYEVLEQICFDNTPNLQWVEVTDNSYSQSDEWQEDLFTSNSRITGNIEAQATPTVLILDSWTATRLQISTSHVRHAELTNITVSECLKLVANAPYLQSLKVYVHDILSEQFETTTTIIHSGMQTVEISGEDGTVRSLLASLRLPSLISLRLGKRNSRKPHVEKPTAVLEGLLGLLRRSLPPVEELRLSIGDKRPTPTKQTEQNKIMSGVMTLVGPTLRELDFDAPMNTDMYSLRHLQDFVDSIFVPGNDLSRLRSVALSAGEYWWCHLMYLLVKLVATGKFSTPRPIIAIHLYFKDGHRLHDASDALLFSCFNQAEIADPAMNAAHPHSHIVAPEICLIEIEEMLSAINTHGISFKIISRDQDMFPDIRNHLLELCGGNGTTQ